MKHNVFDDAAMNPKERRKSIFEIFEENNSIQHDFERINRLYNVHYYAEIDEVYYTLKNMAEEWFPFWKNRGRCLDFTDYLDTIEYDKILAEAPNDVDAFITYIEFVYNMWYLCERYNFCCKYGSESSRDKIRDLMDEVLSEMNQKAYYDPETEQCLIGDNSPQVTAAVEATELETASQILHYNHRQLAGEISKKKAILQNLAKYLEGRESELKSINMQLFKDINSAFNNLDIRHNNIVQRNSSDYKEKLAQMPPEEMEKWYDEVYQLILLAILEMDNVERRDRIRKFIQDLNSKDDNSEEA